MRKNKIIYKELIKWLCLYLGIIALAVKRNCPDNDIWFLSATGKAILENGFIKSNPFSIDDLGFTVQQVGVCIINYLFFSNWGKRGILLLTMLFVLLLLISIKTYIQQFSKDKVIVYAMTLLSAFSFTYFYSSRGSIITATIILAIVTSMIQFQKEKKKKYLASVTILIILLTFWQSAMWIFGLIYMLPFYMPDKLEYIVFHTREYIKNNKAYYDSIIKTSVLSVLLAFICSPYKFKSIAYPFLSLTGFSNQIIEHQMPRIVTPSAMITVICLIALTIYIYEKKLDADTRIISLAAGSIILSTTMFRNMWFVMPALCIPTILLEEHKKNINFIGIDKSYVKSLKLTVYGLITVLVIYFTLLIIKLPYSPSSELTDNIYTPRKALEYLSKYSKSEVSLLTTFADGGYFEYKGYKVYIDARSELYSKNINDKKDVFKEYIKINNGTAEYQKVFNEYKFTHIMADKNSVFYYYMMTNTDYKAVLSDKLDYQLFESPANKCQ